MVIGDRSAWWLWLGDSSYTILRPEYSLPSNIVEYLLKCVCEVDSLFPLPCRPLPIHHGESSIVRFTRRRRRKTTTHTHTHTHARTHSQSLSLSLSTVSSKKGTEKRRRILFALTRHDLYITHTHTHAHKYTRVASYKLNTERDLGKRQGSFLKNWFSDERVRKREKESVEHSFLPKKGRENVELLLQTFRCARR